MPSVDERISELNRAIELFNTITKTSKKVEIKKIASDVHDIVKSEKKNIIYGDNELHVTPNSLLSAIESTNGLATCRRFEIATMRSWVNYARGYIIQYKTSLRVHNEPL